MSTHNISKRQLGQARRHEALRFLACVGYASTRQLAYALTGSTSKSSTVMVSRTVRWLIAHKLVTERRDDLNHERLVALTKTGAQRIRDELELAGDRVHAHDLLRHAHAHRTVCNSVYANYWHKGIEACSELEVRAGYAENLSSITYKCNSEQEDVTKIPDLVVKEFRKDGRSLRSWVEVENGWRSERDLLRLVYLCKHVFQQRTPPFDRLVFIVAKPVARKIRSRLLAAMKKIAGENGDLDLGGSIPEIMQRVLVHEIDSETLETRPLTG